MSNQFIKNLPPEFVENVRRTCGAKGELWLTQLPELIAEFEESWRLTVGDHFSNLTYNFVAPATRVNGSQAVLKLGLPVEDLEIYSEAEFLRHADGKGAVRLLAEDRTKRALLLERLVPGRDLKEIFSDEPMKMVNAGADVLKRTIREPPSDFEFLIDLDTWFQKLNEPAHGAFPKSHIEKALKIAGRKTDSAVKLIHGDYHHTNILSRGPGEFVVIDPKGVIGDVRYDIGVFLNNHLWFAENVNFARTEINYAVEVFAETSGFSAASIGDWAYAQATLSAFWTFTEGGDQWKRQLALADFWNV